MPEIELPAPQQAIIGQVTFTVLSDGSCQVGIGGNVSTTHMATIIGLANSHLGGILFRSMGSGQGIAIANGSLPGKRG